MIVYIINAQIWTDYKCSKNSVFNGNLRQHSLMLLLSDVWKHFVIRFEKCGFIFQIKIVCLSDRIINLSLYYASFLTLLYLSQIIRCVFDGLDQVLFWQDLLINYRWALNFCHLWFAEKFSCLKSQLKFWRHSNTFLHLLWKCDFEIMYLMI